MVFKVTGQVVDGLGQSSGWMPLYLPNLFPGTLNVELIESVPDIYWEEEIVTHWNKSIKLSKCLINNVHALIVRPPLANIKKRPKLVEIAAEFKLREELNLKNQDLVKLTFNIS